MFLSFFQSFCTCLYIDSLSIYNIIRFKNGESYIILFFFDKRWYHICAGLCYTVVNRKILGDMEGCYGFFEEKAADWG